MKPAIANVFFYNVYPRSIADVYLRVIAPTPHFLTIKPCPFYGTTFHVPAPVFPYNFTNKYAALHEFNGDDPDRMHYFWSGE